MVTVVLACALVAGFRVPADWTFDRIDLATPEPPPAKAITWPPGMSLDMYAFPTCEESKLRVYLHREMESGKTIEVPAGCEKAILRIEAAGGDKVRVTGKPQREERKP